MTDDMRNSIKNVFEGIELTKEKNQRYSVKVDTERGRKCLVLNSTLESLLHLPRATRWTTQRASILEIQHKYDLQWRERGRLSLHRIASWRISRIFRRLCARYIEAKYRVVGDKFMRTERWAWRFDVKDDVKNKPRQSQWKVAITFHPIHQDCQRGYDEILKVWKKCRDAVFDMAEKSKQAADGKIMNKKKDGRMMGVGHLILIVNCHA